MAGIALAVYMLSVRSAAKHVARPAPQDPERFPGVTLLKPVKGLEEGLEENLRSVFAQQYPGALEIVFSATDKDDPALKVARKLSREFPSVKTKFVVADPAFGLNPKVANLAGAVQAARFDLLWQSDANVRVTPTYLRELVAEMIDEDASMVTSVVIGTGERSVGAALENLQLTAYIAPAMCVALHIANITCVCGKSMLLRKSEFDEFGGLESVRDVLCEDFVLGQRYEAAGKKVVLSRTTVENVNIACGVEQFVQRHSRWLKMRATLHAPGFVADFLGNPVGLSALAVLTSGFDRRVSLVALVFVALKLGAEATALEILRTPMALRHALLSPVKDLLLVPLWVHACFSRTVVWRGVRLRFGKDTQLLPLNPAADPETERAALLMRS